MKKFVTAVMLLSFLITLFPALVGAAEAPKLYLNGKQLSSSAEPKNVNSRIFVPIRTVTEGLGYDVEWKSPNVTISNGETMAVLTIGSKKAVVNDQEITLDAPAMISKNMTYVPLRFVGEQFGLDVDWDADTRSVHMYAKLVDNPPQSGSDGGESTDPGEGSGDPGSGTEEPGTGGGTTDPSNDTALLNSIVYDGIGSIYMPYAGDFGNVTTQVLHNPERIVVDLPSMNFDPYFLPGFLPAANGTKLGEILVDSNPTLQKIRYSYYSDKPSTVRVVLDMAAPTNFKITNEDHVVRIDVLEQTGPIVPPPVNPPTTPDKGEFKVVLDAGHGGKDPGASSVNGRKEKEFNLAITLKVKALLDKETKIKAYLTRSDDTFVELADRANFANKLPADIFVSFHANIASSATVSGSETYYWRSDSLALAKVMHKHLVAGTGLSDRGVRTGNFHVIRETKMPAVLLETGYLSNNGDSLMLYNAAKQDKLALEIVAGIKEYLKLG
ncbi:N-acetylmuramoyl-L-alanine amidase [Paenibacillus sacheonensis]|uniref:AMIN domain-containing protein n=1 Tax=Paenibacillus sacheonensis TaxID=742054 RepID=A0A7X5BZZ7_9BACL|nr:N-acetylmuramoyl-L-alanine amidase [Paenibacillus sacheonensis]MBM7563480.1 N-acetylmuramoyl-L-alanine amidase [Paenibacillus sacheonensis]NBC71222.1 AMIN domain-containing protein [Paenibacillus sacheonensis]